MTISQATLSSSPKRRDSNSSFKDDPLLLVNDQGLSPSFAQQHHQFHHRSVTDNHTTKPTVIDTKDKSPSPSIQAKSIAVAKQHGDNENEKDQQQTSIQDKGSRVVTLYPSPL